MLLKELPRDYVYIVVNDPVVVIKINGFYINFYRNLGIFFKRKKQNMPYYRLEKKYVAINWKE